ncbi:MAG: hypothetical protein ACXACF_12555 [Candidatus Hermodarchaeia archaeon]|jgi:hypothetical protein
MHVGTIGYGFPVPDLGGFDKSLGKYHRGHSLYRPQPHQFLISLIDALTAHGILMWVSGAVATALIVWYAWKWPKQEA